MTPRLESLKLSVVVKFFVNDGDVIKDPLPLRDETLSHLELRLLCQRILAQVDCLRSGHRVFAAPYVLIPEQSRRQAAPDLRVCVKTFHRVV